MANRTIHYEWRNKPQQVMLGGREFKFKSLIEYKWAQYLQHLLDLGTILEWDYEPRTFEFGERYRRRRQYTPDFRVKEQGSYGKSLTAYHEVKTSLRQTDIRRFRLMAADYPEITMVLVLPYCSRNSNQSRLRGDALRYVERIVYANPLFKKFSIC